MGERMPTATREGFRPDIQGLRAVAVAAVVLDHASIPFVRGGYVGVDVFFVISGFLISSHLLAQLETHGRIRFASFYARRARRILPASLVVLVLSIVGAFVWVPPLLRTQVLSDAVATALYVPNYAFAVRGTDYLAESTPSVFQHYWSLGVEEQFYLLWPALLGLVWLLSRSRVAIGVVLGVLVSASFAACVYESFHEQPWAFFPLWTRAWELGLGGLVALVLRRRRAVLPPLTAAVCGWLGLTGIVAASVLFTADTLFPGYAVALPVVATALVILAGGTATRWGPTPLLGMRPFQFVGLISYSLYLVHWPMLVLAQAAVGYYTPLPVWATALLGAAAVPIAWLLYRLVEDPARRAPLFARARPRRSLLAALGGALAAAALAVAGIAGTALVPLATDRAVASTVPTSPPRATPFVPANLTPTLRAADDDNPSLYDDGCEVGYTPSVPHPCTYGAQGRPRIVLFGDSHAAQWFPALQKVVDERGYQLETQTKSACASVDTRLEWANAPYVSCDKWRRNVIAQVRANPPALVILANYTDPDFADPRDTTGQWERGLESTIRQLSDVTRVVVIADTPDLRNSPTVCLSAHLDSADACGRPASFALDAPGRPAERAAADRTGVPLLDLTGYFCSADECPAIIGNTLVYRDSHHVSATYSAELAGVLGDRLAPYLAPA